MAGNNDIVIDKLLGLNTSGVKAAFGQPNKLENVVLDPRGGYGPVPGLALKASISSTVGDPIYHKQGNYIFAQRTANAQSVDLDTGVATTITPTSGTFNKSRVMNLGNEGIVCWTPNVDEFLIVGDSKVVSSLGNGVTPTVTTTQLAGVQGAPATVNSPYYYNSGGEVGWEGGSGTNHTIIVFILDWAYNDDVFSEGTTLNPGAVNPRNVYPIVLNFPNVQIAGEFTIRLSGLSGKKIVAYGSAYPASKRLGVDAGHKTLNNWISGAARNVGDIDQWTITMIDHYGLKHKGLHNFVVNKAGSYGTSQPGDWSNIFGDTVKDGTVELSSKGITDSFDTSTGVGWMASVINPPLFLLDAQGLAYWQSSLRFWNVWANKWQWAELRTSQVDANTVDIFRGKAEVETPNFTPMYFMPFGPAVKYAGRSWVLAEWVQRFKIGYTQATRVFDWEQAQNMRTLYYSEPLDYFTFLERYIVLEPAKSDTFVAVRSFGSGLIVLGDEDAVVITGQEEANFAQYAIDVPGAYAHDATLTFRGSLYYLGKGGFYRFAGERAENIGEPVKYDLVKYVSTPVLVSDPSSGRLFLQPDTSKTTVYIWDTVTEAWSTCELPAGYKLVPGDFSYVVVTNGMGSFFSLTDTAAPLGSMTISFEWLDGGDATVRKQFSRVAIPVQFSGTLRLTTMMDDSNDLTETKAVTRTGVTDFRLRDRHGTAISFTIKTTGLLALRPGWRIAVTPEGENFSGL